MDISKKIKATLGYSRVTQTDLGNHFGTTQANISARLRNGNWTIPELEKIAEACGCRFEAHFVFDDGTKI